MDLQSARRFLAAHGWLSLTSPEFIDAVIARCILRTFDRGDALYRLDDDRSGLVGIASGSVGMELTLPDQHPFMGDILLPGSWVGAASLLTRQNRRVGIHATRPTEALFLTGADFNTISARIPEAIRWIGVLAVQQQDRAVRAAVDLMIRDPRRRAVAVLLRLAGLLGPTSEGAKEIDINQEQLALLANLSRSTLNTLLRDLEAAGLIIQSYRKIAIIDGAALKRRMQSKS